MRIPKLIVLLLANVFLTNIKSQSPTLLDSNNTFIKNKCYEITERGSNWWLCGEMLKGQLFMQYKQYTGLSSDDSMHIIHEFEDSVTNFLNIKYQQYYKGLPIEFVIYHEHSIRDTVVLTTGFLCEGMVKNSTPNIEEDSALSIAINYLNAEEYAWENDSLEFELKNDSNASDTTYYPRGTLIWAFKNDTLKEIKPNNFELAWLFKIYRTDSFEGFYDVYVNAQTGIILKSDNVGRQGNFNHYIYGSKSFDTKWLGGSYSKYYLETDEDGIRIKTKNNNFGGSYNTSRLPNDEDDNWGNDYWAATAVHWGVTEAWKFWRSTFKRNGFDDGAVTIRVRADYSNNSNTHTTLTKKGTGYDIMTFDRKDGYYDGVIDIIGHEFTHGVIGYTCQLRNEGEPGSVAESTADIFGLLLEANLFGLNNFTIGEDANPNYKRDLQNPQNNAPPTGGCMSKYPRFYMESGAMASYLCKGGVHHNASIQNQCFFFLSFGGTLNGVSLSGIGIDKATQILHLALIEEYKPITLFSDSREGWINAAIKLFGRCSNEHIETCKAWAAVNVGNTCFCVPPSAANLPCWRETLRYPMEDPEGPRLSLEKRDIAQFQKLINVFPSPTEDIINIDLGGVIQILY